MRKMDEIKEKVHRRVHSKVVQVNREAFNQKKVALEFSDFEYTGLTKAQSSYVNLILKPSKKKKSIGFSQLEKRYYRVYENDKIERLFPYATLNSDSTYSLKLLVKKEKNIIIDFGGNVSSRPINTGYLGLTYNALNKTGSSFHANTYFGKLYTSVLAKARLDIPIKLPFYIEPIFAINRWNYFRSRATFFEANNSLFLIQNEQYAYLNGSFALSNKTKFTVGGGFLSLRDDYYQTSQFGQDDIADKTTFVGNTLYAIFEKNSLNAKLYPNSGSEIKVSAQLTSGDETYLPGTTSNEERTLRKLHQWVNIKASYDVYYKSTGTIRLGLYAEAVYSNLELFTNYTASSLRSPAFKPTPESSTLFLESFRAYQYAAIGQKVIFNVYKNVDLRFEGYVFQPYRFARNRNEEGLPPDDVYDLARRYTIATANAVYKSPLGPISVGMNYYYNVPEVSVDDRTPLTFLFHFGYILFNAPALK
jgi:NTE family protein